MSRTINEPKSGPFSVLSEQGVKELIALRSAPDFETRIQIFCRRYRRHYERRKDTLALLRAEVKNLRSLRRATLRLGGSTREIDGKLSRREEYLPRRGKPHSILGCYAQDLAREFKHHNGRPCWPKVGELLAELFPEEFPQKNRRLWAYRLAKNFPRFGLENLRETFTLAPAGRRPGQLRSGRPSIIAALIASRCH